MNYRKIHFYAIVLFGFAGCNDGEFAQTGEMQADVQNTHDMGGGDANIDVFEDVPTDANATQDADTPPTENPCNLEDNIPDDCYEVPALTLQNAQTSTRVQVNGQFWSCNAAHTSYVFDVECFLNGSVAFPSTSWRNAVFDEGKIMSIKFTDPTSFAGQANLVNDSPSWVDVGGSGSYDMSISRLPGDFSHNLPDACIVRDSGDLRLTVENAAHAILNGACWLDATKTYYLNVRLKKGSCVAPGGTPTFKQCSHTFVGYGHDPGW